MTTPLDVVPDVKAIGKEWLAVWNERRNPDLSHKELDYFSAFLTWLHERGYLTTYRTQEKELREALEFYAKSSRYDPQYGVVVIEDRGRRARDVLSQHQKGKE